MGDHPTFLSAANHAVFEMREMSEFNIHKMSFTIEQNPDEWLISFYRDSNSSKPFGIATIIIENKNWHLAHVEQV